MTSAELLQLAQSLNERDEPYAMVTVVRVAPPTSAYVGAQAHDFAQLVGLALAGDHQHLLRGA